jgi:hypothetical protein
MAKNPIAVNDGGLFRFVDFMNYVPDFLKEEEDVVTLMQMFSDYLNNAYRNLEDSTRFTFNFLVTESTAKEMKNRIDEFVQKLSACDSNNLYVYYLSLPRTNATYNTTDALKYIRNPIYYNGAFKETIPLDVFKNLMKGNSAGDPSNDGDVIYIQYKDNSIYPYYINKADNLLVLEPKRSSQDPFKSTLNTTINGAPRVIKFIPRDVGEPIVSFIGQINNANVYSIKFDVTINEVENSPSKYREKIGEDIVDIDMYKYLNSDYVFVDNVTHNGLFNWNGDTPTGIFYFKDLYEFINGENSYIYHSYRIEKVEFIVDEQNPSISKYGYLTLSNVLNLNVGDKFIIESNEVIGNSNVSDVTLAGSYNIESAPCGNVLKIKFMNAIYLNPGVSTVKYMTMPNRLYKYSLSYSSLGYDYSRITPKIKWDPSNSFNADKITSGDTVYPYTIRGNKKIGEIRFEQIYSFDEDPNDNNYYINVKPKNFVDIQDSIEIVAGNHYYFEYHYGTINPWKELFESIFDDVLDMPLASYSVSGGRSYFRRLTDNSQVKFPNLGNPVSKDDANKLLIDVYEMDAALGSYDGETTDDNDVIMHSDVVPEYGDFCLLTRIEVGSDGIIKTPEVELYTIQQVDLIDPAGAKYRVWFDKAIPIISGKGIFEFTFLVAPKDKSRAVLGEIDFENCTATCRYRYEDIFSADYWIPSDGLYLLKCAYTDEFNNALHIEKYINGKGYNTGDMIYMTDTKSVCRVVKPISGNETYSELTENGAIVPYMYNVADIARKVIYNEYMEGIFRTSQMEYGETVDITKYDKLNSIVNRLFIEKADDNRLIFGWKDRDFLMNMATYNTSGKARSGFCEFYTTYDENDIVLKNMENYSVANTIPGEGVSLNGLSNLLEVTSTRLSGTAIAPGTYIVEVVSKKHNLPDKSKVRVTGVKSPYEMFDFNTPVNEFDVITVVDENKFTYIRHSDYDESSIVYSGPATITGYRDIYNPITSIDYYVSEPVDDKYKAGYLYVHTAYPHGYSVYTKVSILNAPTNTKNDDWINSVIGSKHKVDVIVDDYVYGIKLDAVHVPMEGSQWLHYDTGTSSDNNRLENSYSMVSPEDGDVLNVDGTFYKVNIMDWTELSGDTIDTPFYVYSHQNIMDITSTNPSSAKGDDNLIESITFDGNDTVTVVVHDRMDLVEKKSCVYITQVYPLEFNGRYVVDTVVTPRMFTYKVVPKSIPENSGKPVNNCTMTCTEGKWFKYIVSEVMVNRKSVYEIFKYGKKIVDDIVENTSVDYIETEIPHGYTVGTRIVVYAKDKYYNAIVLTVENEKGFRYRFADNTRPTDVLGGYVFKGVYIPYNGHIDDVEPIGQYQQYLNCIDSEYDFQEGDLVFAYDNLRDDMPKRYIVKKGLWTPCSEKRIMKIKKLDVDRYHNNEWDNASVDEMVDEYVYHPYTYTEVERMVANDLDNGISSYIMPFHIRSYNFASPYVENLDTTEQPMPQFNSKHDYASVAPRFDMDEKFKGIPDMKYPLVEKLERLIYLRDAKVIDYDLIGYLARFMGYDITDAKNDVDANRMYATREAREKAVRETVSNLPQYYTLGGTRPGLEMLMETFGIVAEVITMWTDVDRPYDELIEEDQVSIREDADYEQGKISKWVPTPHVKVKFRSDANFDNGVVGEDKVNTLIKNIKCFKPIHVVFDDFIKYLDLPHGKIYVNKVSFVNTGKSDVNMNYDIEDVYETELCGKRWDK